MRRNIHYKPSKGASIFGGIIGCAMGIFGLFAIPDMGAMIGFKAIWCLMTFGMGIYNFLLAAGVVKYNGGYEITDESDESAKGGKSDAEARLEELQTLYDRQAHHGRGVSGKAQGHSGPAVRERSAAYGNFSPCCYWTYLGF